MDESQKGPTMRSPDRTHAYTKPRFDVVNLISGTGLRVLDLGCSTGVLGAELIRRGSASYVDGVEIDSAAAEIARRHLRNVWTRSLEDIAPASDVEGPYDVIVTADVLEHVSDPWKLLSDLRSILSARGRIVASIPNIRYWSVIYNLAVRGRFEYQNAGVLDRTHLRFFTRHGIQNLFESTGYDIETIVPNHFAHRGLNAVAARMIGDLAHVQYLVVARAAGRS